MKRQCAFSSAWLEHHLDMVGVGGSSPLRRTIAISFQADFFALYVVSIDSCINKSEPLLLSCLFFSTIAGNSMLKFFTYIFLILLILAVGATIAMLYMA